MIRSPDCAGRASREFDSLSGLEDFSSFKLSSLFEQAFHSFFELLDAPLVGLRGIACITSTR